MPVSIPWNQNILKFCYHPPLLKECSSPRQHSQRSLHREILFQSELTPNLALQVSLFATGIEPTTSCWWGNYSNHLATTTAPVAAGPCCLISGELPCLIWALLVADNFFFSFSTIFCFSSTSVGADFSNDVVLGSKSFLSKNSFSESLCSRTKRN